MLFQNRDLQTFATIFYMVVDELIFRRAQERISTWTDVILPLIFVHSLTIRV